MPAIEYQSPSYWRKLIGQSLTRFLILRVLRSGPLYGYILIQAVGELSDGLVTPSEGTVYTTLGHLNRAGLVTVEEKLVNGRTQKIYKLTETGRAAFRAAALSFGKLLPVLRRLTTL